MFWPPEKLGDFEPATSLDLWSPPARRMDRRQVGQVEVDFQSFASVLLGWDWPEGLKLKDLLDRKCLVLHQVADEVGPIGFAIGSVPVVYQDQLIL